MTGMLQPAMGRRNRFPVWGISSWVCCRPRPGRPKIIGSISSNGSAGMGLEDETSGCGWFSPAAISWPISRPWRLVSSWTVVPCRPWRHCCPRPRPPFRRATGFGCSLPPPSGFMTAATPNRPWLPEIPEPVTQVAWQTLVLVPPSRDADQQVGRWGPDYIANPGRPTGSTAYTPRRAASVRPDDAKRPGARLDRAATPAIRASIRCGCCHRAVEPLSGAPDYFRYAVADIRKSRRQHALALVSGSRSATWPQDRPEHPHWPMRQTPTEPVRACP